VRISEIFGLNVRQAELDFVDVDIDRDTPLFLDPFVLSTRTDPWSVQASNTVRSFFHFFINLLYAGQTDEARILFDYLHEPNETSLGLSRGRPRGNGIGDGDAQRIFESLASSRAAQTGLLNDLEDCRIFVNGVDKDKTSDMTTNIIRKHLLDYTVQQCSLWGIPMEQNAPSGFYWSSGQRQWESGTSDLLFANRRKILLVPKAVVSYSKQHTPQQFHQHFVLNFLQHEHLRMRSALVRQTIRKGRVVREYVTKKSLVERANAGFSKEFLTTFTNAHPEVFRNFQQAPRTKSKSLPINDFSDFDVDAVTEYLSNKLQSIPFGRDNATAFHRTVVSILDFALYPRLTNPIIEREIHEGRKRIDLTFDNGAPEGFFLRLPNQARLPCPFIFVECKNYGREIGNPEIDQLGGRFSFNRGKVGLLVCRSLENPGTLIERCRDTYRDDRGLILPLVDDDLLAALQERAADVEFPLEQRLQQLYAEIAL
jgi:hypothetical protein